jgi:LysM repeat protein
MDTISRENNSSMLPVGGIIVGVIGLLLGGFGLMQASKANKAIEALQPKVDKVDGIEAQATAAAGAAEQAKKDIRSLQGSVQTAFTDVGNALGNLQTSVTRLEELAKKPVVADKGGKKNGEPAVAGPGEYIVKAGDVSGTKIAAAQGVSIKALQDVNPGVNWSNLKIGQRLKLPKK